MYNLARCQYICGEREKYKVTIFKWNDGNGTMCLKRDVFSVTCSSSSSWRLKALRFGHICRHSRRHILLCVFGWQRAFMEDNQASTDNHVLFKVFSCSRTLKYKLYVLIFDHILCLNKTTRWKITETIGQFFLLVCATGLMALNAYQNYKKIIKFIQDRCRSIQICSKIKVCKRGLKIQGLTLFAMILRLRQSIYT